MKTLPFLSFLFLLANSLPAQQEYERVDSIVQSFQEPYSDPAGLALLLTKPFRTEREKARAIFAWVSFNIRYDYKKYKDPPSTHYFTGANAKELEKNMREYREKGIRSTLKSKKGVCSDYSHLVQKMCEAAGLECTLIGGQARTLRGRSGTHAWNAVKFDGRWHLLDATWGAGFIDREDEKFVRRYSPAFFDTAPSLFILNHLPDEEKWQMLEKPLSKKEFAKQPTVNFSNPDYPITAYTPGNGKIVPVGGKAEIRIQFGAAPKVFVVSAGNREFPTDVETTEDGWTVLRFAPGGASEIKVFGGESWERTVIVGKFEVE